MKIKGALAAAALAICGIAAAQNMGPSPEVQKLYKYMSGEWTGKVKWMMPGMPEESTEMPFKVTMEGNFIKSANTMDMGGMSMTETTYMGWDPVKKRYTSWTFTNFGAMPRVEHGNFEGDSKFVSVSEPWDIGMGEPIVGKATMTRKGDNEMMFVLEFKQGDKWMKVAEGTFKRKMM